ncbi:hypothetical protein FRC20_006644 [Serendipita sp. 405]|nr:hypothetical protein FRC20_006644 [Serendipita sp. 405]
MKLVTKEEIHEFESATRTGGIKGAFLGLGLSLPTAFYFHRTSPRFRAFPLPLKTAAVVMLTSATTVVWAERAGMAYDRQRYWGQNQPQMSREMMEEEKKKKEMVEMQSSFEKFKQLVNDNKYTVILGSWATTMGIAWKIINKDQ